MTRKYKALVVLMVLIIFLPLALFFTLAQWLPVVASIWLPPGTRIVMNSGPALSRHSLTLPDFRYIAGDCELARLTDISLNHSGRWRLKLDELTLNPTCIAKIPSRKNYSAAPYTLAQWQAKMPRILIIVNKLSVTSWTQYQGRLMLALSQQRRQIQFNSKRITLDGKLENQKLMLEKLAINVVGGEPPVILTGQLTLSSRLEYLLTKGQIQAQWRHTKPSKQLDAFLTWQHNSGQLIISHSGVQDPILDLPWTVTADKISINNGRWFWPYQGLSLRGRIAINVQAWQQGLEHAIISGRLNAITEGDAGKGNAVATFGPGKLSMSENHMPFLIHGQAKYQNLILYASLPMKMTGTLTDPTLMFQPGALLRSQGQLTQTLSVDDVRLPLAGVKMTRRGLDGRLQAILRAHKNQLGELVLHLDGKAKNFLPDRGCWQWHYWGKGSFMPLYAKWDVNGVGDWHDNLITLRRLSTGFDQLTYGQMTMHRPRLNLIKPIKWRRDTNQPNFAGELSLNAGETLFVDGRKLPPAILKFNIAGTDPMHFQFDGSLHAQAIGPVRLSGRWNGERLRGQAWWPRQTLAVFQSLIPAKINLIVKAGTLYAQVFFSAAINQAFEAGGHAVLNEGSAWLADNQINGINFILPFRYSNSRWQLGVRRPVTLHIAEIKSQFQGHNFTADLQGQYPWNEKDPLLLSNVSVGLLDGRIRLQQLRFPQKDAALLRLENLSTSELMTAINVKQFALSGRINGALPLWVNHSQWLIKDGWITNPGPLTLRVDKNMVDAIDRDNIAASLAINWLRYIEIARSWTNINLNKAGELSMQSRIEGVGEVKGHRNIVKLNYHHQENLFTLWRSLRYGDNLQSWLEQHIFLPGTVCTTDNAVCKENISP